MNVCDNSESYQKKKQQLVSMSDGSKELRNGWTILACVCCKEKKVAIFVPNPQRWTVANIKEEVEKKIGIPARDQVIYCNEKVLPEQLPLVDCEGMRNGAALLVGRKPFIVNVYRTDADITIPIEMPRIDQVTTTQFCEYICRKFGIHAPYGQDEFSVVLAVKDQIMKTSESPVLDEYCISNGCSIVLDHTVFREDKGGTSVNKCSPCSISIQPSWILHIQQHGGSKVAVDVPTNGLTPVANLRQLIKDKLSVETYQQRLTTVGGEILEDYDDDGQCLLLCNYPAVYDGATLYLVRLTGGMYVEHKREQHVSIDKVSKQNLCYPLSEKEIDLHQHINITDPNTFTIKKLAKIMNTRKKLRTNIYEYHVYGHHFNALDVKDYPDETVASIPWLTNGTILKTS